MKIATYNIMSGGFGNYSSSIPKTPERLPLLKQALKTIGADFLGLVDTFHWRSTFLPEDLQKIFDYRCAFCIDLEDLDKDHPDRRFGGVPYLTNLPV